MKIRNAFAIWNINAQNCLVDKKTDRIGHRLSRFSRNFPGNLKTVQTIYGFNHFFTVLVFFTHICWHTQICQVFADLVQKKWKNKKIMIRVLSAKFLCEKFLLSRIFFWPECRRHKWQSQGLHEMGLVTDVIIF